MKKVIYIKGDTQTVFNKIVKHFIKQKKRAINPRAQGSQCKYRTDNGETCAIGCLIPESEYTKSIENKFVGVLIYSGKIKLQEDCDRYLLSEMQNVHDTCRNPEDVKERLKYIVRRFKLKKESLTLINKIKVWS